MSILMPTDTENQKMKSSPIRQVALNHCPLCKKPGAKRLFGLERFDVFKCECGMRYIDPSLDAQSQMAIYQSSETLTEINAACENYYEYETLDPKSLTYHDYKEALERAAKCTEGRDLLEAGCGAGTFLKFAREKGWVVAGVDSSSENIDKVRQEGMEGHLGGFFECKTLKQYDCVVLWDLIEHPQDPGSFVDKSYELLKPGGLILIATPCYPNFLSSLSELFYKLSGGRILGPLQRLYMLEHTTYFGSKTLAKLLEPRKFKVVDEWKTETDLKRYHFSPILRICLNISFFIARLFRMQNRIITIAKKQPTS